LNGIPLIEEDNQQDLGVIISNDLHPHCHISHIVKKANQRKLKLMVTATGNMKKK
jgi:hypothetical protein